MKSLNKNQMLFNEELIKLLEKHSLKYQEFLSCVKVLFPKEFKSRSAKFVQIKECSTVDEVNEFIKDKTLRGTGIYKNITPTYSSYLIIYYKEV